MTGIVLATPATNSVGSSNHLSGTAMDLNWQSHAFRIKDAGFNPEQIHTIRELLEFYEGMIFWGNDWNNPKDAMHWQMGYDTFGNENVAKVNDFIRRRIRPDGYSTFRREGQVPSGPPSVSAVDVLARATGISHDRALDVLPQVSFALIKANCNNPRRSPAALAQWVIESGHFEYTEEIASGPERPGAVEVQRQDLDSAHLAGELSRLRSVVQQHRSGAVPRLLRGLPT